MRSQQARAVGALRASLVAPCGMNCAVCSRAFRSEARCRGCRGGGRKPKYCGACAIRNCVRLRAGSKRFCHECSAYPCSRLRRLDTRYRRQYGTSLLRNLESIRDAGLQAFLESEKRRWQCPGCGRLLCIHKEGCITCGRQRCAPGGLRRPPLRRNSSGGTGTRRDARQCRGAGLSTR